MATTIKAVRGTVLLGDVSIGVYMLPNGSYKLAGRNVTDAIGEPNNSLIRNLGVQSLKDLPNADLSLIQVKANTGETFIAVSPLDAVSYWGKMALQGHKTAVAILMACAVESIERRADSIFGVVRTEGDRNIRFKALVDRILENPKDWTIHFKSQWQREACRVTGYRWEASRPMAQFISTYIYKALPKDVYAKLMDVNANRKSRHHQFFDDLSDDVILKEHIQQVGGLLRVAKNKPHFKQLFSDAFGDGMQIDLDFGEEAS
jgi:P63C domain